MDAWRKREGIRRPWLNGSQKRLNENLAPLRRFLQSNVGRPWNKVYSEVCERINRDSAVQYHVWQHLMMDVCTDPHVICGDVKRGYWSRFGLPFRFYVDPRSGLLRESKRGRPPSRLPELCDADKVVKVDEWHECRIVDGIWYELERRPLPNDGSVFDLLLKKTCTQVDHEQLRRHYGSAIYTFRKRQLGKKEIRRLPKWVM
jgi:hypothetical protein